ncbi:hypothetical protein BWP39_30870 [Paraburkholderia acidicola]|uniref:Uncharacterized protein n=1 Tax=Paraburkholderia acidicola TaxID=1912599 RepID=A0A2A4EVI1_9BURK|nr:hypothetical protein BWP39_30870 [Paraburkholderia acidicola]
MKRAVFSAAYLAVGLSVSWQVARLSSRLAQQYSWPLLDTRWHGCWDIEHCQVPWWGYAVIVTFLFGPAVTWAVVGFQQAPRLMMSRFISSAALLVLVTAVFYLSFYVAVWP